jgi:hypothetical protein
MDSSIDLHPGSGRQWISSSDIFSANPCYLLNCFTSSIVGNTPTAVDQLTIPVRKAFKRSLVPLNEPMKKPVYNVGESTIVFVHLSQ